MLESFSSRKRIQTYAEQMKSGNTAAATGLYELLVKQTYGFYFSRLKNRERAEDLTQDIFTRLVRSIGQYDPAKGDFVVWYWRMARNMLVDYFRGQSHGTLYNIDELPEAKDPIGEEQIEEGVDRKREKSIVRECLAKLSKEERELFELRYIAELSYADIAKTTGKNEGALRVAANRLKNKLEKEIKALGVGD